MKKVLSAVFCAVMLLSLTACGNKEEKALLKPTININETTITLPCALKDIGSFTVYDDDILEYDYDGIAALSAAVYCGGRLTTSVTLDNRDKDLPLEEKTIVKISLYSNTEFHGIRCNKSKWEDACEIVEPPYSKAYYNFLVPLENGYYLDCRRRDKKVTEMTV